ncbi:MAG: STAS domain-containing protein [Planctomycetota bacterium]
MGCTHASIEYGDGWVVVALTTARLIEPPVVEDLRTALLAALDAHPEARFRLDFTGVEVVGSLMLALLAGLHQQLDPALRPVVLSGLGPELRRLLTMTRLDTLFVVEPPPAGD